MTLQNKIWAIGDLHGCGHELLAHTKQYPNDEFWLLGDLFDRADDGAHLVWDFLQQPNHFAIKGNHDLKIEKFLRGERNWVPDHYQHAIKCLNKHGVSNEQIVEFISKLPMLVRKEVDGQNYILVHAAVDLNEPTRPDVSINIYGNYAKNKKRSHVNLETSEHVGNIPNFPDGTFWWDHYTGSHTVLYGHLVSESGTARMRAMSVGLDTAVVHGGAITAFCLNDRQIVQYTSGVDHFGKFKELNKKSLTNSKPGV